MSNHTPGPWKYSTNKEGRPLSIFPQGQSGYIAIADIAEISRFPEEEVKANARLIAAAPELVDKFKEALGIITNYKTPQAEINKFLRGAAELLRQIEKGDPE